MDVQFASTPKLFSRPKPIPKNASQTEKKIYSCLKMLNEMELEILSLKTVKHIYTFIENRRQER